MTVCLDNLTIRYGDLLAVDAVTAEIPAGAVGLLGRNGAGKSSILKALLGLVRPAAGAMRILDLPANAAPTAVRAKVGYMPERDCYIPDLNGFETVAMAARLTGVPALDAARRAHEVLYLVKLEEQRYRKVSGYSLGMRQKVKLAVALVHDPAVLFLDEPTNGLDPGGREEMLALVEYLAGELEKSVVISTHILQDVERTCHSVVLLEQGRVRAAGPLAELTSSSTRVYLVDVTPSDCPWPALLRPRGAMVEDLGHGRHRLTVPEDLRSSEVFAAVHGAGGVVRRLAEHRRTLEEVFLGAVGTTATGGAA